MSQSPRQFFGMNIRFCFLAFFVASCLTGRAAELEVAPWERVVGVDEQSLPGREDDGLFFAISPEELAALPKLAKEGNVLAAAMMAGYSRHERGDVRETVSWLRMAVQNGDVDSAFTLGELYFPSGGAFGRENFDFKPDIVLGYVWHAIGLSGLATVEKKGGKARKDSERAQEMVDGLRMLLLPSERTRVADILAKWPEDLPPDIPLEPMPRESDNDRDDDDFSDTPPMPTR